MAEFDITILANMYLDAVSKLTISANMYLDAVSKLRLISVDKFGCIQMQCAKQQHMTTDSINYTPKFVLIFLFILNRNYCQ